MNNMKELSSDLVGENRNLMIKLAGYRVKMLASSLSRFARPAVRQFSTTVARSFLTLHISDPKPLTNDVASC